MGNAIAFPIKRDNGEKAKPVLDLPGPRIWTPQDLAGFLRVKVSWVHRRTAKASPDPPPRCPGVGELRFDTHSPAFQSWIARQIGLNVDTGAGDE